MRRSSIPGRTPLGRRRLLSILAVTGLVGAWLPATAGPAAAAVVDVQLPHNIVVFPERDFVVLEGYTPGQNLRVEVVRDGVQIGYQNVTTAEGETEINHPGGYCWAEATPNIIAGDVVRVLSDPTPGAEVGEASLTAGISANPVVVEGTDLVVRGSAVGPDGQPIPIDRLEQRIINPDFKEFAEIGRRDLRATSDGAGMGTIAYDAAGSTRWTARYTGLSAEVREAALAGQTRIMSWRAVDAAGERIGLTIFEAGETGGPGFGGCPPSADYAVTSASPQAVNIATDGQPLTVRGTSYKASSVAVTLDDSVPGGALVQNVTPQATAGDWQTWEATFGAADVSALAQGPLTVSGRYTLAGGVIGGVSLTVLKDLEAPAAPTATPAGGTYATAQSVALSTPAEPGLTIHSTVDGTTPGLEDPAHTSPVSVTADQTLKAVAVDAAGNLSQVATHAYVITGSTDPEVPAPAGDPLPNPPAGSVVEPPAVPLNVVVFPERDFVVAEGFGSYAGKPLTIRVLRNGVVVGTARGVAGSGDPSLEVNHPGGVCWEGSTPDIQPGDRVEVLTATRNGLAGQATTTANVTAQPAFIDANGDVVVHGTAVDAAGNPLSLDLVEQRIINPEFRTIAQIGRRDIRATSDGAGLGTIAYDAPGSVNWTARYAGLTPAAAQLAVEGQTRVLAWQVFTAGERAGITIYEAGEVGGPGFTDCPELAPYAATSSTPQAANVAWLASDAQTFQVSGVAHDASAGTVTLSGDGPSVTKPATLTPAGPSQQTWTALFTRSEVEAFADGTLTATPQFTVGTSAVPGLALDIRKDGTRPATPTATPATGTYWDAQAVTLSNPVEKGNAIHYTVDNTVADSDDARYQRQIAVATDTVIRAVAVDAAGNESVPLAARYQVLLPVPGTPTLASASDSGTVGDGITKDATPTITGSAAPGLTVDLVVDGTVTGTAVASSTGAVSITSSALTDGVHSAVLRARHADGRTSRPSAALTLRIDTIAPTASVTSGPAALTNQRTVSFGFASSEAGSTFRCGLAATQTCASPQSFGPLPDGSYTFSLQATDAAGNPSSPITRTFRVDATAVPAPVPTTTLAPAGTQLGTTATRTVPVRVTWARSTATDLARYELYRRVGTTMTRVATVSAAATAPAATVSLVPDSTKYTFVVRTIDAAGNRSDRAGASFVLSVRDDRSVAYTSTPAWSAVNLSQAYGGTIRQSARGGAAATAAFSGTQVAWAATLGANRGTAEVYIDNRLVRTVNLYSASTVNRRVVFSQSGLTAGNHTLHVRVTGLRSTASTNTFVDIDAVASLR